MIFLPKTYGKYKTFIRMHVKVYKNFCVKPEVIAGKTKPTYVLLRQITGYPTTIISNHIYINKDTVGQLLFILVCILVHSSCVPLNKNPKEIWVGNSSPVLSHFTNFPALPQKRQNWKPSALGWPWLLPWCLPACALTPSHSKMEWCRGTRTRGCSQHITFYLSTASSSLPSSVLPWAL